MPYMFITSSLYLPKKYNLVLILHQEVIQNKWAQMSSSNNNAAPTPQKEMIPQIWEGYEREGEEWNEPPVKASGYLSEK